MHRFFIPEFEPVDRKITLSGPVARQIKTVLRLEMNDQINLFDGSGSEWLAEIDRIGKTGVYITLKSDVSPVPEPIAQITMLLGLARPERIEFAIQKCTELGAVRFVPVISERVQRGNKATPSVHRLARWRRIAIEAAEQSGRATVPAVEPPQALMEAVEEQLRLRPVLCMWEETADSSLPLKRAVQSHKRHTTELATLIGPPGGFSHNEASAIQKAGADLVTLGPRVLRTETAAVTTISTILYELGDLGG